MVDVAQDQITRKWGFRIIEGTVGSQLGSNMGINRILCEDFVYDSPQEVFQQIEELRKSLSSGFYKPTREGTVFGYQIFSTNNREIIYAENGWIQPDFVSDHLEKLKQYIQGDIKMVTIPPPQKISIPVNSNTTLRSTYTDPVTGKVYDSGGTSTSINLDEVRRQAQMDAEADIERNSK